MEENKIDKCEYAAVRGLESEIGESSSGFMFSFLAVALVQLSFIGEHTSDLSQLLRTATQIGIETTT